MADTIYIIEVPEPEKNFRIQRFDHEDEQGFLEFVAKQYRAKRILRQSDGVIVWEEGK